MALKILYLMKFQKIGRVLIAECFCQELMVIYTVRIAYTTSTLKYNLLAKINGQWLHCHLYFRHVTFMFKHDTTS